MSTQIVDESRNYYCSNKFTYLKIDLEKFNTYCCHAATPHKIDAEWLKNNPGQLFNTPLNTHERELMLANQRNASCEQNCYPAEDRGQVSTRMLQSTPDRRYTQIHTYPQEIDLTLFSDCNLTCTYCCKEFSSSWRHDLTNNGSYVLPDFADDQNRWKILPIDVVSTKVSQNEKKSSSRFEVLWNELKLIQPHVKKLTITGGEPFLNNTLLEVLENIKEIDHVDVFTGMGVEFKRFQRMLESIKQYPNVTLAISAENIGPYYEFNRYGMQWSDFVEKVNLVRQYQIPFEFHCTISNLSVIGFHDFYKMYGEHPWRIDFVHRPVFMTASNLDPTTKKHVTDQLLPYSSHKAIQQIIQNVNMTNDDQDRTILAAWLQEFAQRRNLDLNIFPKTFLEWIAQ